jgi:hypothetical protein
MCEYALDEPQSKSDNLATGRIEARNSGHERRSETHSPADNLRCALSSTSAISVAFVSACSTSSESETPLAGLASGGRVQCRPAWDGLRANRLSGLFATLRNLLHARNKRVMG